MLVKVHNSQAAVMIINLRDLLVSKVLNLNYTANSPKSVLFGGAMFLGAN